MYLIVRAANRLLKHAGLRIQPITKFKLAIEALIRENKSIKFIQVGANDGIRFDDLFFTVTYHRWKGIVIEPLPDIFLKLAANYQDYPDVIPLNLAIHPSNRSASIYYVDKKILLKYPDWVAGSASMSKTHLIKAGVSDEDISERTVECKSLMEIAKNHDLPDIDLLQIDTEGFDFEIIKSIDFKELKPRLIKFEWMNLSANDQKDVSVLLIQNGYKFFVEKGGADCVAWLADKLNI